MYTILYTHTDPAMWKSIDELARKIQASGNFAYLKVRKYVYTYTACTYTACNHIVCIINIYDTPISVYMS